MPSQRRGVARGGAVSLAHAWGGIFAWVTNVGAAEGQQLTGAASDLPMGMAKVSPRDPDRPQEEQEHCHAAHMPGEPVPPPLWPTRTRIVLPIGGLGASPSLCRAAELQTITKSDRAWHIEEGDREARYRLAST